MNRILILLSLLSFLFTNILASSKVLKIAMPLDMSPYAYINTKNEADGILVDYWRLWSKKTNIKITFVASSWKESLNSIKNKTADIHVGLFKNEKRSSYVNYIAKIYPVSSKIFINIQDVDSIKSINDLKNKMVGVLKGTFYESYLKEKHPFLDVRTFELYKDFKNAIKKEEIDAFLDDDLVIWMNIIRYLDFQQYVKLEGFDLNKHFNAGIRKNDENLEKLVLNGISLITNNDMYKLEKKWILKQELRKFKKSILSQEEEIFLNKNKNLTLSLQNNSSFINQKNPLIGFHLDLIKKINKNLNINIGIKNYETWTETYESVLEGKHYGVIGLSKSKQREEFFLYSSSYYYSLYNIISRSETKNVNNIKALENKKIVTTKNAITNMSIKRILPNQKINHVKSYDDILTSIANKKYDYSIVSSISEKMLKKHNLKISKKVFLQAGELHIGIKKEFKYLQSIINKGLSLISKEEMQKLKNKWFIIKSEKSIFTKEELEYIKTSPTLKVGIENWNPVISYKNEKRISGLSGEILNHIFDISGLNIININKPWNLLLDDFKNKKIDILPSTIYTKEREKLGEFSNPFLHIKNSLYIKKNNKRIKFLKDLNNKKIAIIKSYAVSTFLKKKFPNIEIVETINIEDSINKVLNGSVDALLESQIVVENKLRELLITNLKEVPQNEITNLDISMLSIKNDFILKSILQKSIYSFDLAAKNKIISKWIEPTVMTKDVSIAVKMGKEPYTFKNDLVHGIEYDLIKKVLNKNNINISYVKKIANNKYSSFFKSKNNIDIFSSVKEENPDYFYSNEFLSYENVAISRVNENLFINSLKDLKNKRIAAFGNASSFLGEEYKNIVNSNKTYYEIFIKKIQVKMFLENKVDILIMDKNMFKWYIQELSDYDTSDFKIDYIFKKKNSYKVAFKDENLRNIFNSSLSYIKRSGEYEEVFNEYLRNDLKNKVKIYSLISASIAKSLYEENTNEIAKIISIFTRMDFINKIEVFGFNKNTAIYSSTDTLFSKSYENDSFYINNGIPNKVGYVKVSFDNAKFLNTSSFELIPNINNFKNIDSFRYIKEVYGYFNFLNENISFSKKELDFIKQNPILNYSEVQWEPLFIKNENNESTGLISDFLNIVEKKTGLVFRFKQYSSWSEIIKKFKENELDFLPGISLSSSFQDIGIFTKKFLEFNYAIVSNENASFMHDLKDLNNSTVAVPISYSSYSLIKDKYPLINIVETNTVNEALELVSTHKVDAFVGHEAVSIFKILNDFKNLKILGVSSHKFEHAVLVSYKHPLLVSIFNKVFASLTYEEKQKIRDKWITTKVNTAVDYMIIYQIVALFSVVLIIILFFLNKLRKINLTIKEQKYNFEKLFYETSDSLVLIKNDNLIDCNNSILKLLEYKDKKEFLNLKLLDISPLEQYDGSNSLIKLNKFIYLCIKKGTVSFEWLCLKSNKEVCWVDIVLTKITINNENLIHVVLRDIKKKKILEKQVEKRTEELELSLNTLKQAQNRLIESEKMASLGSLVAGVAHEINTPVGIGLTGISHLEDLTRVLKDKYEKEIMSQEEFEEYLSTNAELSKLIHLNLDKAASLVRSFKQVAVDQSSEEKRKFNLYDYLNEILSSIHSVTKKTNITIEIKCLSNIQIESYPGAFSQIITNLIMNSLTHGFSKNEKGLIGIDIKKINNQLIIKYEDSGSGIKEENVKKIFNPFFTTNRKDGGSGLGLNIIYNIITSNFNGDIRCISEKGKGAQFLINLNI